ncbi:MAG TPA: hypothetical protein VKD19_12865, partial [Pseudolabrys sp.]|nr:hypothetical protein [Pseudolabrys sp.]
AFAGRGFVFGLTEILAEVMARGSGAVGWREDGARLCGALAMASCVSVSGLAFGNPLNALPVPAMQDAAARGCYVPLSLFRSFRGARRVVPAER